MEPNPIPQSNPTPRTLPSAIWSLVLGILSLTCFSILTGIPAIICGHIAHGKIKRSGGALSGSGLALAGLITGYVSVALLVIIIPLLTAIAIPNFVKARNIALQNACISNLRQIESAKQAWAHENHKADDAVATFQELTPYLKRQPICPSGGTYRLGKVSEQPTCSIKGHALPPQ